VDEEHGAEPPIQENRTRDMFWKHPLHKLPHRFP
jgi:hypothetical protein